MAHSRPLSSDVLTILAQPGLPVGAQVAVKVAVMLTAWATRRRTRLALSRLEPWQLRDVGLTPREANLESRRVFWRS